MSWTVSIAHETIDAAGEPWTVIHASFGPFADRSEAQDYASVAEGILRRTRLTQGLEVHVRQLRSPVDIATYIEQEMP